MMMEAARTSETSVDNYFTRQYIPEDKSELHTRRRENLKSHIILLHIGALIYRAFHLKRITNYCTRTPFNQENDESNLIIGFMQLYQVVA
jgi:hypothetical protein